MLAVLEHQEHHLSPSSHRHVKELHAARVGDPLEELDLPQRREGKPILLLVVQDDLERARGRGGPGGYCHEEVVAVGFFRSCGAGDERMCCFLCVGSKADDCCGSE